jgi:hypothetical protein
MDCYGYLSEGGFTVVRHSSVFVVPVLQLLLSSWKLTFAGNNLLDSKQDSDSDSELYVASR